MVKGNGNANANEEETRIRTGDTVIHGPSGETWIVAYADYRRGILAWVGWPPGHAQLSDCKRVKACTDEENQKELVTLSEMRGHRNGGWDARRSYARRELLAVEILDLATKYEAP